MTTTVRNASYRRRSARLILLIVVACALPLIHAGPLPIQQSTPTSHHHAHEHEHHVHAHETNHNHPHEDHDDHHHDHDDHHHDHDDHQHDHHHAHQHESFDDVLDHSKHHNCIHDKIEHPSLLRNYMANSGSSQLLPAAAAPLTPRRQLLAKGRNWDGSNADSGEATYNESDCGALASAAKQPLRLVTKASDLSGLDASKRAYLQDVLMPQVEAYFEATLKVVRLSSNLLVASNSGPVSGADGITVEANDKTVGFADADYLLYYSATDSPACSDGNGGASDALAYASAFEVTECDRPLVGYIHFCPSGVSSIDSDSTQHATQLSTAKHEVTHAMGFSSRFYAYYRNSDMTPRTTRDAQGVPSSGGYATAALSNTGNDDQGTATMWLPSDNYFTNYTDTELGGTRYKFKTANVLAKARSHFGCSSLDGLELENQGSKGSWGSHWEKRIIGNEYMSAIANEITYPVSQITLGLFEDMGFWGVDYSQADDYTYMRQVGCETVTKQCLTDGESINSDYFCNNDSSTTMCTFDGAAEGYCNKGTAANLASYYYHFGDTSTAGNLFQADYCPTVSHYKNRVCTDGSVAQGSTEQAMGAEFSSESRCFYSSLWSSAYNLQEKTAGCYKHQCLSGTEMQINIYSSQTQNYTVECTSANAGSDVTVAGFNGVFNCPDPADLHACGSESSYASLSALTVVSGSVDLTSQLIPAFSPSQTEYKLNIGHSLDSLAITPTTTSPANVTMLLTTIDSNLQWTQEQAHSGTTYNMSVDVNYNTFKFKITNDKGQERVYRVGVTRSTPQPEAKAITITLNMAYESVQQNMQLFRTTIADEITSILNLQNLSQFELYTVTEGSVKVLFTLSNGDSAAPAPYALDATLGALFNDKNSVLFDTSKYNYLPYMTLYAASSDVIACVDAETGAQTCSAENCNIETGACVDGSSDGDDEAIPSWAMYAAAGVGALIIIVCCICLIRKCCCGAKSSSDETSKSTKKSTFSHATHSDLSKTPTAPAVKLQPQPQLVQMPQTVVVGVDSAAAAKKGKFSNMMLDDSDSSDDEASTGSGQQRQQV